VDVETLDLKLARHMTSILPISYNIDLIWSSDYGGYLYMPIVEKEQIFANFGN